jgi:hypothetical protein
MLLGSGIQFVGYEEKDSCKKARKTNIDVFCTAALFCLKSKFYCIQIQKISDVSYLALIYKRLPPTD